jgi:hypothetical protein
MESDWNTLFAALNNVNIFSQETLSNADKLYNGTDQGYRATLNQNLRNAELQELHWRSLRNRDQAHILVIFRMNKTN